MANLREQQLHARQLALQARIAQQRHQLVQAAAPLARTAVWADRVLAWRRWLLPSFVPVLVPALWLWRRWWRRGAR